MAENKKRRRRYDICNALDQLKLSGLFERLQTCGANPYTIRRLKQRARILLEDILQVSDDLREEPDE